MVYVAGVASACDFPTTHGAFQAASAGGQDAFVACLDGAGRLVYSTYLGGSSDDVATGIAVDASGNVYVSGYTNSINFPTTAQAPQRTYGGGFNDAFVAKLNSAGNALIYSTLLGGTGSDVVNGLALSASGGACVAGRTDSPALPLTHPVQPALKNDGDALIACINAAGTQWSFLTYLGGSGEDLAYGIAIDSAGTVYVSGTTTSADFPTTARMSRSASRGDYDIFVVHLNPGGPIISSTVLGGTGSDAGTSIALDASGAIWVAGYTSSVDIPVASALQSSMGGSLDGYVARLTPDGSTLQFATYLGGSGDDRIYGLAIDSQGNCLVAGATNSTDFPVLQGTLQSVAPSSYNGFIARTGVNQPPSVVSLSPASGVGSQQSFTVTVSGSNGQADVQYAFFLAGSVDAVRACSVVYLAEYNLLFLVDDSGTFWLPQLTLGSPGTVSNGQCTLNAGASSVVRNGVSLGVTVALTFAASFTGSHDLFANAMDTGGLWSGWKKLGSWSVPAGQQPPSVTSMSPASGTGTTQSFTVTASDANGQGDIQYAFFLAGNVDAVRACSVVYLAEYNLLFLVDDSGSFWLPQLTLGSPGTVSNGQCTLNAGASSVVRNGVSLGVTVALTFSASFTGPHDLYGNALNYGGLWSGWKKLGSWTVPGQQPPSVAGVSPASGTGSAQSFTVTVSDPNGQGDIQYAFFLAGQVSAVHACSVVYLAEYNLLFLVDDSGSFWLPQLTLGSPGTVSNSQCALNAGASSVVRNGVSLGVTVALTFAASFTGPHDLYGNALDYGGLWSGWKKLGSWTVR